YGATYTSCPPDGSGGPHRLLTTKRVSMDFDAHEGGAGGGGLRLMGVPILGAPGPRFPPPDARQAGRLPPPIQPGNKSGFQLFVPYYWNIAPNRDATFTPGISTRRGASLGSEFRYLEPHYSGLANLDLMPNDRLTGRSRYALTLGHDAALVRDTQLA